MEQARIGLAPTDKSGFVKHGIGQGHKAAPAIWLFISSFLFEILSDKGNGVTFFDPAKTMHHHRVADGYVDDVTGFCNTFEEDLNGNWIQLDWRT